MLTDSAISSSFEPLTHLKKGAREKDPAVIKQVAKQFESLFVQMMLKSMRDTVPENELFGSHSERLYRDMYDKQLSLQISNGRGIGLAKVIERQLGAEPENQLNPKQMIDYLATPKAIPYEPVMKPDQAKQLVSQAQVRLSKLSDPAQVEVNLAQASATGKKGPWHSADEFINDVWPHALRASEKLGIDADVLMAQSALETGWGKHLPLHADGSNSFNLFGIKADQRWQGDKVEIMSREYRHGVMQQEKSEFRAYDSISQAFEDYTDFIISSPRYQRALQYGYDGEAYARELQKAGYATDPDYAKKIIRVRGNEELQAKASELKQTHVKKFNPPPLT